MSGAPMDRAEARRVWKNRMHDLAQRAYMAQRGATGLVKEISCIEKVVCEAYRMGREDAASRAGEGQGK